MAKNKNKNIDLKQLAIELRNERKSYSEISRELGVAKSTLAYWFSKKTKNREEKKLQNVIDSRKQTLIKTVDLFKVNSDKLLDIETFDKMFVSQNYKINDLLMTIIQRFEERILLLSLENKGDREEINEMVAIINSIQDIIAKSGGQVRTILALNLPEEVQNDTEY